MWKGLSLLAAGEFGAKLRRSLRAFSFYAASVLIALIGLVFALQAANSWLVLHMSTVSASLIMAAAMLGIAGILLIIGQIAARRKSGPSALTSTALVVAPLAAGMIARKVSYGTIAVAGVVAMGVFLGRLIARD